VATVGLARAEEALASPSDEQLFDYMAFAEGMLYWGYSWEPIKVTTDDGYILTTFRITGKIGHHIKPDETLNPVMLMHGLACDAVNWVGPGPRNNIPMPFRLFDRGFDIYLASNRGTKYC
jgi:lysosomal acid lipase/cholesteryl ester hydrolase